MRGRADAGVGLEHAVRQADDGLQVALGQEQFAQRLVGGIGGAEQHAVGHDDAGASAGVEMVDEPFQEEQFGVAGVELVVEVGEDAFLLHLSGEGRVGEDEVELLAGIRAAEAGGERVEHARCAAFSNWCR